MSPRNAGISMPVLRTPLPWTPVPLSARPSVPALQPRPASEIAAASLEFHPSRRALSRVPLAGQALSSDNPRRTIFRAGIRTGDRADYRKSALCALRGVELARRVPGQERLGGALTA